MRFSQGHAGKSHQCHLGLADVFPNEPHVLAEAEVEETETMEEGDYKEEVAEAEEAEEKEEEEGEEAGEEEFEFDGKTYKVEEEAEVVEAAE